MNHKPYRHVSKPPGQPRTVTAHQAVQNSPSLGRLAALTSESNERLAAIAILLPDAMRSAVKAGPIEGETWCLLVNGSAAAAKLRQLTPIIKLRLMDRGWKVTSIRLKILMSQRTN